MMRTRKQLMSGLPPTPPVPSYTAQRARTLAAKEASYQFGYRYFYVHYLDLGMDHDRAREAADRDARVYADKQVDQARFFGPWFWVAVALALPSLGTSFAFYLGFWILRRKARFGIPAPLEGLRARTVIR